MLSSLAQPSRLFNINHCKNKLMNKASQLVVCHRAETEAKPLTAPSASPIQLQLLCELA